MSREDWIQGVVVVLSLRSTGEDMTGILGPSMRLSRYRTLAVGKVFPSDGDGRQDEFGGGVDCPCEGIAFI